MKRISNKVSAIALSATLILTLLGTSGSSAAAENTLVNSFAADAGAPVPVIAPLGTDVQPANVAGYAVQPDVQTSLSAPAAVTADAPPAIPAASLERLVASRVATPAAPGELTGELKCLAGAIYFEARSESLEGQLAVGRVIIDRTRSGRFPASYCGVVYQPSQFSFVRGQSMPSVNVQSPMWQRAVALAQIADAGTWQSSAEGALFFHAARIGTNWRVKRVAQIDHHIFYR